MVIDTSALVAILLREPEWELLFRAILSVRARKISAISRLEMEMVIRNRKSYRGIAPARLVERLRIETLPFDETQLAHAVDAFRTCGKGRHKAALNLGDCCAHGLAKTLNEPPLFKGGDFSQTDIASVPTG